LKTLCQMSTAMSKPSRRDVLLLKLKFTSSKMTRVTLRTRSKIRKSRLGKESFLRSRG
jgi:hypothetical protein